MFLFPVVNRDQFSTLSQGHGKSPYLVLFLVPRFHHCPTRHFKIVAKELEQAAPMASRDAIVPEPTPLPSGSQTPAIDASTLIGDEKDKTKKVGTSLALLDCLVSLVSVEFLSTLRGGRVSEPKYPHGLVRMRTDKK